MHLKRLITFLKAQGLTHIQQVARTHLEAYQEAVAGSGLTASTQVDVLRVAVGWFSFLCDYGDLSSNPALVVDPPRRGKALPRAILSETEFQHLLGLASAETLLGLRDRCVFEVLYASAMRPEELCRLTIADVDLSRQRLYIRRPKNRRDRIVVFDKFTAQDLKRYLARVEAWLGPRRLSDPFFVNANGGALNRNAFSTHFATAYALRFKERYLKHITLYSLRHTSATDWLDSGARSKRDLLPYVQRQLGHESLESTAVYTHVAIEHLRQMFKQYHPREQQFASLAKIPGSADTLQGRWEAQRKPPPPEPPSPS